MIVYTFESHHAMSCGFTSNCFCIESVEAAMKVHHGRWVNVVDDKANWKSVFMGMAIDFSSLLFSQAVDRCYSTACERAAPYTPSRLQIEDEFAPLVDYLIGLGDKAEAHIKQSFRGAGTNDAVVVEMFKQRTKVAS